MVHLINMKHGGGGRGGHDLFVTGFIEIKFCQKFGSYGELFWGKNLSGNWMEKNMSVFDVGRQKYVETVSRTKSLGVARRK